MSGQRFNITVAAEDKSSAIFAKVGRSISDLSKPLASAESGMKRLADSVAMESVGKRLDAIGSSAKSAIGALGGLAGITSAGGAVYAFNNMMGGMANLSRQSAAIGIQVEHLQELQGAYRRVGGNADGMTESVKSLGYALREANVGHNDEAMALAMKYGIDITPKHGKYDVERALLQIADVYRENLKASPQTSQAIAKAFGLGPELDPLLREGAESIKAMMTETAASGVIMSGAATEAAKKYQRALVNLEDSAWGVANALSAAAKPVLTDAANATTDWLKPWAQNPDLMWAIGKGAVWKWGEDQADNLNSLFGYGKGAWKDKGSQSLFDAGTTNPSAGIPFDQLTANDFLEAARRRPITTEHSGAVHVEIEMKNAPPGTVASVRSTGHVDATARIESSMPAYGP